MKGERKKTYEVIADYRANSFRLRKLPGYQLFLLESGGDGTNQKSGESFHSVGKAYREARDEVMLKAAQEHELKLKTERDLEANAHSAGGGKVVPDANPFAMFALKDSSSSDSSSDSSSGGSSDDTSEDTTDDDDSDEDDSSGSGSSSSDHGNETSEG